MKGFFDKKRLLSWEPKVDVSGWWWRKLNIPPFRVRIIVFLSFFYNKALTARFHHYKKHYKSNSFCGWSFVSHACCKHNIYMHQSGWKSHFLTERKVIWPWETIKIKDKPQCIHIYVYLLALPGWLLAHQTSGMDQTDKRLVSWFTYK